MEILKRVTGTVVAMEVVANAEPREFLRQPRDVIGRWIEIVLAEESEHRTTNIAGEIERCRHVPPRDSKMLP